MKFYLASRFTNRPALREVRGRLQSMGHEVTSSWLDVPGVQDDLGSAQGNAKEASLQDLLDIERADALILFPAEGLCGAWVEFGFALGVGLPVAIIGDVPGRGNIFESQAFRLYDLNEAVRFLEEFHQEDNDQ